MIDKLEISTQVIPNENCVDLTQADLDRGLTSEQIAREKADLNWRGFRREITRVIQDALAKESESWQ